MNVLGLMTQKGGTGKATLAASLGVVAHELGERIFLIERPAGCQAGARRPCRYLAHPNADLSRFTVDRLLRVAFRLGRKVRVEFVPV